MTITNAADPSARVHRFARRLLREGIDPTTVQDALFVESLAIYGAVHGEEAQARARALLAAAFTHMEVEHGD